MRPRRRSPETGRNPTTASGHHHAFTEIDPPEKINKQEESLGQKLAKTEVRVCSGVTLWWLVGWGNHGRPTRPAHRALGSGPTCTGGARPPEPTRWVLDRRGRARGGRPRDPLAAQQAPRRQGNRGHRRRRRLS